MAVMAKTNLTALIKPMLANRKIYEPHSRKGYLYEIKLQGERCLAIVSTCHMPLPHTDVYHVLRNRHGKDITDNFPEIKITLPSGIDSVVLDGEICVLEKGIPKLPLIQSRSGMKDKNAIHLASVQMPAVYFVFDILQINYKDITEMPLSKRKEILKTAFIPNQRVRELMGIVEYGESLFESAVNVGHEGVMAKRLESRYWIGKRSDDWQKIKPIQTELLYAVGLTKGKGVRASTFGALVVARTDYEQKAFVHVGTVGSGLKEEDLKYWFGLPASEKPLCKLKTKENVIRWIDPYPVEVEYFEVSDNGLLIHPRLKGR